MKLLLIIAIAFALTFAGTAHAYKAHVDTEFTDSCWSKLVVKLSSGGHTIKKKTFRSDPTSDDSETNVDTTLKFKASDVKNGKIKASVNLDNGFNTAVSSKTFNPSQKLYDFVYHLETDEQTCFQ